MVTLLLLLVVTTFQEKAYETARKHNAKVYVRLNQHTGWDGKAIVPTKLWKVNGRNIIYAREHTTKEEMFQELNSMMEKGTK